VITPVRDRIREMLWTVDFNDESRISAQEIDFHSAPAVERDGKIDVHLKSSARLAQRFQPSIEECLGRAFGRVWRLRLPEESDGRP